MATVAGKSLVWKLVLSIFSLTLIFCFSSCAGSPSASRGPTAEEYYDQGDYDQAIAAYTQEIDLETRVIEYEERKTEINKLLPSNYYRLGKAYFGRGRAYEAKDDGLLANANYDQAITALLQSIKTDLDYEKQEIRKQAQADANMTAEQRRRRELGAKYNNALGWGNTVPTYTTLKHADVYYDIGRVYIFKEDDNRAIRAFTQAIEADPKDKWSYYLRALCYRDQGNRKQAIADLTQVLVIDPNYQNARDELQELQD